MSGLLYPTDGAIDVLENNRGNFILSRAMKLRARLMAVLKEYLTPIETAVMQSFLLGGRSAIPNEIRDLFVVTGTAHVLAISGQNITIISMVVFLFLRILRIPRAAQFIFTIVFLAGYAFLTGLSPSVARSAVMAIIFWMAFLFEREGDSLNSLGFAALVILLMNPLNIFDIGFQLSFAGVFSIIYFYPTVHQLIRNALPAQMPAAAIVFLQALSVSLAAWVGVAGLILYHFQVITPVTILANLPIIPFMTVLMILGLGLLGFAFIFPSMALMFSYCIKLILKSLIVLIFWLAHVPGGYFYFYDFSVGMAVGYYVLLIAVFWLAKNYWIKSSATAPMVADLT